VVFCGVMNYPPNEEGAIWLARDVWPIVRRSIGSARLRLVGAHPTTRVQRLAANDPSIEVTGEVADVRPYLWNAAAAAAPLHVARGIQNKALEAIAAGLPTIITRAVAGGLPTEVSAACTIADDPDAFAAAIVEHLRMSPAGRRAIAESVDLAPLSWNRRLAPIIVLIKEAYECKD